MPASHILSMSLPEDVSLQAPKKDAFQQHWCLVSTNAMYDPSANRNHWLPALSRKQVEDESMWTALTTTEREMTEDRIQELQEQLRQVGLKGSHPADDSEPAESVQNTLQFQINQSLRFCRSMGFLFFFTGVYRCMIHPGPLILQSSWVGYVWNCLDM